MTENPPGPSPQSGIMSVTPTTAAQWLRRSGPRGRNLVPYVVQQYVAAFLDEELPNPRQVVVFDEHGILVDGAHMLKACAEAGVTIEAQVAVGIASAAWASPEEAADGQ